MEVVIRVALMFFLIQFLVVLTIMIVALLLARPEVPLWGRESWQGAPSRGLALIIHVPSRVVRFLVRRAQSMHSLHIAQ
jgi:hypothetical protein